MELRASERELYEGRPSWRALMCFYVLGIGVAVLVLVILGLLADSWGTAVAHRRRHRGADAGDRLPAPDRRPST